MRGVAADRRGLRAFTSVAALLVLVVGIPAALIAAGRARFGTGNPIGGLRPPWRWRRDDVESSLRRPLEDDTVVDLLIRVSLVVAWVAVVVLLVTVVLETRYLIRHRDLPPPRRRRIGWAQPIARSIAVGLVAVLPLAGRSSAVAVSPADLLGPPRTAPTSPVPFVSAESTLDGDIARLAPHEPPPSQLDRLGIDSRVRGGADEHRHVVVRGESVWSIAEQLGDGREATTLRLAEEILDRNLGTAMPDGAVFDNPALIRPGWVLVVPGGVTDGGSGDAAPDGPASDDDSGLRSEDPGSETIVVVDEGDTLSGLAAEHLGAADEWPRLATANAGRVMDDGRVFDDPNLIVPGWTLALPEEVNGRPPIDSPPETAVEPQPNVPDPAEAPDDVTSDDEVRPQSGERDWFDDRDLATPTEPAAPSTTESSPTSTTTEPAPGGAPPPDATQARASPSTLGVEHAAMLAGGVAALAAVLRRRRLRSARPHARVPLAPEPVVETMRVLTSVGPAERAARLDVAIRGLGRRLLDTGARPLAVLHLVDGSIEVTLSAGADVGGAWEGSGSAWELPASVPIELLADDAQQAGCPCPALVAVGKVGTSEMLVDLEAVGTLVVDAPDEISDAVVRSLAATFSTSVAAETAHVIAVGLDERSTFEHPNAVLADDVADALRLAREAVGAGSDRRSEIFDLRVRRTGGEAWEPAVVFVGSGGSSVEEHAPGAVPDAGDGIGVVVAGTRETLVGTAALRWSDGWRLDVGDWSVELDPFGLDDDDLDRLVSVVEHAGAVDDPAPVRTSAAEADEVSGPSTAPSGPPLPDHAIVVTTLGGVGVQTADGDTRSWQRSKTVELIAWLVTHRHRSTRSAARTAMWADDVRDATFSNVVSEARRGLAKLVSPRPGEEWIPRTMTEELLLHRLVVSDLDLLRARLDAARLAAPTQAVAILRPGLAYVTGLPFADTAYLWPDADGIVTDATLLATTFCTELAEHALSLGDVEAVFEATSHGLAVLPGHDDLVALRMRAHARGGDLASVRAEWESYERVVAADAWSDGEPSPRLVDLRRELLS